MESRKRKQNHILVYNFICFIFGFIIQHSNFIFNVQIQGVQAAEEHSPRIKNPWNNYLRHFRTILPDTPQSLVMPQAAEVWRKMSKEPKERYRHIGK